MLEKRPKWIIEILPWFGWFFKIAFIVLLKSNKYNQKVNDGTVTNRYKLLCWLVDNMQHWGQLMKKI